jgi:hypothetical protein
VARPRKPEGEPSPGPEAEGDDLPPLTYRQRLFVHYYLGAANGNGTEAARMAGYAEPAVQASENIRKPNIAAAIATKVASAAMTADEVLARLSDMAAADVADLDGLLTCDRDTGHLKLDLEGAKRKGVSRLIKKIKSTKYGVEVELHDAQAALEKLGRYHNLFRDHSEPPALDRARRDAETIRDTLDAPDADPEA